MRVPLCGPDERAKPLLERGRLNGQSAEEVAGVGGTWSRQMGLGSGLGRPAQLSQETLTPWAQAVARSLPAGGHTPSLPASSSETEQRAEK